MINQVSQNLEKHNSRNKENPRVIISQKTTLVGSHSHFVRPRKYNDKGIIKNIVTKDTNNNVIRIQTEKSENTKLGSFQNFFLITLFSG